MKVLVKTVIAASMIAILAGCASNKPVAPGAGATGTFATARGIAGQDSFDGVNLMDNTIGMGPSSLTAAQAAEVAQLPRKVYFGFDKYDLSADEQAVVSQNVQYMLQNPSIPVLIAGNTDPRGSEEYNFHLGERRANAVKNYMLQQGVPANQVCTVSFGELKPAAYPKDFGGDAEKAYMLDRRAEIIYGQTCTGQ